MYLSIQRWRKARNELRCYNCLKEGHLSRNCYHPGRCLSCKGRHHTLLHQNKEEFRSGYGRRGVWHSQPRLHQCLDLQKSCVGQCDDNPGSRENSKHEKWDSAIQDTVSNEDSNRNINGRKQWNCLTREVMWNLFVICRRRKNSSSYKIFVAF